MAAATAIGVDETPFQRRYVAVVNDLTTSEPPVLCVADGRAGAALNGYLDVLGEADLRADSDGGDGRVAGLHPLGARARGGSWSRATESTCRSTWGRGRVVPHLRMCATAADPAVPPAGGRSCRLTIGAAGLAFPP